MTDYNTPPTKALGDSAPATDWNTYVRDNNEHHANDADHGSATMGSRTLGASGGVISAQFTDASAPSAPGASTLLIYSVLGKLHQRAGASGADEEFSTTDHGHTQGGGQVVAASQDVGGDPGSSYTNNETAVMTPTDSTGSDKYIIVEAASSAFLNDSGVSGRTCFMRTLKDSVQQTEVSAVITSGANDTLRLMISDVHINLTNAATDFEQEVKVSSTGVSSHSQTVIVQEVQSQ